MDKQDGFEKTEDFDFSELIDDDNTITETLEIPRIEKYPEFRREEYKRIDEDFSTVVKKRDYRGCSRELEEKEPEIKKNHGKKKLKKWVYVLILLLLLGGGFIGYKVYSDKQDAEKKEENEKIIAEIKEHFGDYVEVTDDTVLFEKDSDEYKEIGKVYKGAILNLQEEDINTDTKYFHIKDIDLYIKYSDVKKSEEEKNSDRYKKYLPFNINIVTNDSFTMYIDDDKYITMDKEMEFPVIINNYDNKYYVEYNGKLVSISKDDVNNTKENKNTEKKNQSKITTLAYHRVYDTSDKCTDPYVCLKKEVFDKQMKYLSDNDYFSLTLPEMYMYLKGNLQIEKGVVITFDDGYLFKASDEVLDKYGLNGTMFVISGDFVNKYDQFKDLAAIEIQSHTHKMHKNYVCPGGNQGGKMLCAGKAAIVEDLKTSHEALGITPFGFAYPFYDYNETVISALKEAGIKMAFVGRAGVLGRATPKVTDVYKIPRMTVWEESLMSFNTWKGYL